MPLTPLDRVLYLKKTLELTFGERYIKDTDFYKKLDVLLKQMQAIPADELVGEKPSESDFIKSLSLNRADAYKHRFMNDSTLTKHACLEDQISRQTKLFIEQLEDKNVEQNELDNLKKSKLHQMLYHNGTLTARFAYDNQSSVLLGRLYLQRALIGLTWASLAISFAATVAILGLSGAWLIAATALVSAASAYAALLMFGVMNGYFTAKSCLPYYLLGEERLEDSHFYSNDPLVLGIGWGVVRMHTYASYAAALFGLSTLITLVYALNPVVTFNLAILLTVVPLFTLALDAYTNYNAEYYSTKGYPCNIALNSRIPLTLIDHADLDLDKVDFDDPVLSNQLRSLLKIFSNYQLNGHALMSSKTDKAYWIANTDRSTYGLIATLMISGITLMNLVAADEISLLLLSPLLSTTLPLISVTLTLVSLACTVGYAYANQDKQADNRYRLFNGASTSRVRRDELCVSEEDVREEMDGERWELVSR